MGPGLFEEAMMIVLRPTRGCLRIDVDLLTCRIWEVDGEQDIAACRAVPACEGFRNSGRNGFFSAWQRQAVRATRLLKTCGFKVDIHLMRPGCGRLLGMVGPYSVLRQRA